MVSKKFWDRLSTDERDILQTSCKEAQAFHRDVSRKMEAAVVQDLIDGMKFNKIDPAELARMEKAVAPVIEKYKPELGEEIVGKTFALIIEKARAIQ